MHFPDFKSCYTQGDSLQDACEMAADVLCLTLYNLEEEQGDIPAASDIFDLQAGEDEFASLVACDTLDYREFYNNRAV